MTLDDLVARYIEATTDVVHEAERRGLCPIGIEMSRAGVRAVLEALHPRLELYLYTVHQDVTEKSAAAFADGFIDEILRPASEDAAGSATAQNGEENDRRIQEGISTTQPGRSKVDGQREGCSNNYAHSVDASTADTRNVHRENEAGGSRYVGGESNHGVSRGEAAGGSTREDGREGGTGDSIATTEAVTPAADFCEWRIDEFRRYANPHDWRETLRAPMRGLTCSNCNLPISFKSEAAR